MCWPSGDHNGLLRSSPSEVICLGAPPATGATYSSFGVPGSAFAPWRYTMLLPSGDQDGCPAWPLPSEMRRLLLPSASMTNACQSPPSRFDWKAIMEPSGDQVGKALSAFLSAVNWTALDGLLSGPMSMRTTVDVPPTDACTSKRRPSGDQVLVPSMPMSCVTCSWWLPSGLTTNRSRLPPGDCRAKLIRPSGEYEGGTGLTPMNHSPTPKTTRPPSTSATRTSAPTSHSLLRRRAVERPGALWAWAVSGRAGEAAV